ncbi:hypothetical protein NB640_12410 [Oxalobacter vibrioformis]|uniref:Uncharacterized protein n=1 Tax=Oxalobacter vibrioformis TaxID=933080 RepID=A0A9E9P3H2_9BURK|nr:hypothetical protein [Oxalobacter vibrioformis]WAW10003.1 hypothetical protein NB640_12410 [Oxalobacter vibrioformis]
MAGYANNAGWGTALSIGTAGYNYYADRQNAKAMRNQADVANMAAQAQLQTQQQQNNMQASDKMSNIALDSIRSMGQLRAAAGDTALGGANADRLGSDIRMAEGTDIATLETNRRMANNQSSAEASAIMAANLSRAHSVKKPSLIGAGLTIAGGYLDDQKRNTLNKLGYRG